MSKNATCRTCERKYHNCSTCDSSGWETDFCTFECLEEYRKKHLALLSEKYNLTEREIKLFADEISRMYI